MLYVICSVPNVEWTLFGGIFIAGGSSWVKAICVSRRNASESICQQRSFCTTFQTISMQSSRTRNSPCSGPLRVAMCYWHDGSTSGSILRDGCCTVSSWRRQDHNYNFQLGTQDISVAGPDQRWQRGLEIFWHRGVSPAVRCVNSEQPEHEVSRRGHSSTLAHKSCYPTMVGNIFFLSVRGMAQRNRCPGGRPSVRYRRDVKWWKLRIGSQVDFSKSNRTNNNTALPSDL